MNLESYIHERLNSHQILLMTHLVVGFPSLEANWQMLEAMAEVGVDLVELQMPFSEPVADGPLFVRANQKALEQGLRLDHYFDFMHRATAVFGFPHLMMGYYNTVFRLGHERFCARLQHSGGAGFILPDLPLEEYGDLFVLSEEHGLSPILLMTPTTAPARMAVIGQRARGLVYAVARKGVTGKKTELDQGLAGLIQGCRQATDRPLALGFGLRDGGDLRRLQGQVEVGIVGSALLERWEKDGLAGYRELLRELAGGRQ